MKYLKFIIPVVIILALLVSCSMHKNAVSIGIIGGADGPTAIFITK